MTEMQSNVVAYLPANLKRKRIAINSATGRQYLYIDAIRCVTMLDHKTVGGYASFIHMRDGSRVLSTDTVTDLFCRAVED